jgi:uncharacterized membrane protein
MRTDQRNDLYYNMNADEMSCFINIIVAYVLKIKLYYDNLGRGLMGCDAM